MSDDAILVICISIVIAIISLTVGYNTYVETNLRYKSIDKCNKNIECINTILKENR